MGNGHFGLVRVGYLLTRLAVPWFLGLLIRTWVMRSFYFPQTTPISLYSSSLQRSAGYCD